MAKKKAGNRQIFGLKCQTCNSRNYITAINKNNLQINTGKSVKELEFAKYCNTCHKHNPHGVVTKLK